VTDGTDDEPTPGTDSPARPPLPDSGQDHQGHDPERVVRGHRVAPRPRPQSPPLGTDTETRDPTTRTPRPDIRARGDRRVAEGVGGTGRAGRETPGPVPTPDRRPADRVRRTAPQRTHPQPTSGDVRGHHRPAPSRRPGPLATQRPLPNQTRQPAQVADPDPHLGRMGRHPTRVRGDRPGRATKAATRPASSPRR
jgi:hypothetical protein